MIHLYGNQTAVASQDFPFMGPAAACDILVVGRFLADGSGKGDTSAPVKTPN